MTRREPTHSSSAAAACRVTYAPSLSQTHTGPYDQLMGCYMATFEWIAAKGYESGMPVFETYVNDPKDTAPDKLKTKICIPVVPQGDPEGRLN